MELGLLHLRGQSSVPWAVEYDNVLIRVTR